MHAGAFATAVMVGITALLRLLIGGREQACPVALLPCRAGFCVAATAAELRGAGAAAACS